MMAECFKPDQPLVSIIIPCWNAECYVGEAIESALAQTYPNVEVIVIDDGSTDGSLEVIKSFGDRIRWETGPNQGACAARNRGIALARGELIQFLDADDLLYPDKLARMAPAAVGNGPSHVILCDWERIAEGERVPQRQPLGYAGEDEVVWCSRNGLPTPLPLHWKHALQQISGFDATLPCAQERDLHLRLACQGLRFVFIPEVLVCVRRQAGSLSSDSLRVYRQHLRIVQRAHGVLEQLGRNNERRSAALAGLLARDARIFLRAGLKHEARQYFHEARRLHAKGGLDTAYHPLHRLATRIIGPMLFERLVMLKRTLWAPAATAGLAKLQ